MSNNAMVAVCDILGYSNLVKTSTLKKLKDYHLQNIKNIMKSSIPNFGEEINSPTSEEVFQNNLVGYAIFSDTILVYSLSDDRDGHKNVLDVVYRLISKPMFFPFYRYRVGISYGEFYYDQKESIYIGKAMIEAYELEKKQQWSGAALSKSAGREFKDRYPEKDYIVKYDVPVKLKSESLFENHYVINWTTAKHEVINKDYYWMCRYEDHTKVGPHEDEEIEKKILNTEKFHLENCVQCKAYRKKHNHQINKAS